MSAAVECATEVACFETCWLGDFDVGHQLCIDILLALGISHYLTEDVPVGSRVNHEWMLGRVRYILLFIVSHLGSSLAIGIRPAATQ